MNQQNLMGQSGPGERLSGIEARLNHLERSVRRYRTAALVMGVLVAALGVLAAVPSIPDVLQARRFEVVDERGRSMLTIESDQDGGNLTVLNAVGEPVVTVAAVGTGSGMIGVGNHVGNVVVALAAEESGGVLSIVDDQSTLAAAIAAQEDGAGLILNNREGRTVFVAASGEEGEGVAAVFNKDGEEVWGAP